MRLQCGQLFGTLTFWFMFIGWTGSIRWLAIHKLPVDFWNHSSQCPKNREERKLYGLVTSQAKMCRRMPEVMSAILSASAYTVDTCQKSFADRRWNCTSILTAPNLQSDLTRGTKEQAFVYALSAASITHQIAKACVSGQISNCPCGYGDSMVANSAAAASTLNGMSGKAIEDTYKWKGCSDNVVYGKRISREWADMAFRQNPKKASNAQNQCYLTEISSTKNPQKYGSKAKMNQHNSDVGRQITEQSLYRKCKCHGVSSSCDVRSCWYTLPPIEQIAERQCNVTSNGPDSCESLCCGRGFNTKQVRVEEQCHCKYVHCCYIKCKKCVYIVDKHYCK